MKPNVITRFAPSPTGNLHIGSVRTALFNYLFTKKAGGKIILRIDDTDRERSKKEYEENIRAGLNWLGLEFDEEYRQSERGAIYQKHLEHLLATNQAYEVTEEHEGKESSVIRFKNPNKEISFQDLIRGLITFDTTELGDFVIAKSLTEPLYHLASVIDDHEMGVTHVIRGEDHISNTPRQIIIGEAIGASPVTYAHIPLILSPDRSKLSKRHGATAVTDYQTNGYLKETLINFLALLGWSPQSIGNNEEIFQLEELINIFDIHHVQKSGAIFNVDKLNWLNHEHMKRLSDEELLAQIQSFLPSNFTNQAGFDLLKLKKALPIILDRINTFKDFSDLALSGELNYLFTPPKPTKELLKNTEHLAQVKNLIGDLTETDFTALKIKEAIWDFATEKGRGEVLWPVRVALTGLPKSPDPFIVAEMLGKQETLLRLTNAQNA